MKAEILDAKVKIFTLYSRAAQRKKYLKQILSFYTKSLPQQMVIKKGVHGKPFLAEDPQIHFNMSHCKDLTLIAVTKSDEVGIDVENICVKPSRDRLAKRFFSQHEYHVFSHTPEDFKSEIFFQIWTRKEAHIKATGKGMSVDLRSFTTMSNNQDSWVETKAGWFVKNFVPTRGYMGAIAIKAVQPLPIEMTDCDDLQSISERGF